MKKVAWTLMIGCALSANVYAADTREQCVKTFQASMMQQGLCGSGGCSDEQGRDESDVCGKSQMLKGVEKKQILEEIAMACFAAETSDLAKGKHKLSSADSSYLDLVPEKEARQACADPARKKALQAAEDASEKERVAAEAKRQQIVVGIGSPEKNITAKFGKPRKINKTVTTLGVHKQYVYGSTYIYADNGIVTAFQEQE